MRVLFVHQNYPAQFGHVANYLTQRHGYECAFVSQVEAKSGGPIRRLTYKLRGGATIKSHYCSRTFENAVWHSHAVFEACKATTDFQPDLIVGHSGFGSTLFLRELYDCPIINYFEYFYRPVGSDMDFRPDFPTNELSRLRARARNAMLLLDLDNCDVGYSPTRWQRDRLPRQYHDKVNVIFDGIDTTVWKPDSTPGRTVGAYTVPDRMKVITYATRGMESMRGFDIFMNFAQRLAEQRRDVMFLIAGQDRICYGGDETVIGNKSFKDWVLQQQHYDLDRFVFLGLLKPLDLARLFSLTSLHVYLTVPFVLSWSLMNALACGATVLASKVEPVEEMITEGKNGLLVDFFDIDRMVERAHHVLDHPDDYRSLGPAGVEMIQQDYSMDVCLPRMLGMYEQAMQRRASL